MNASERFNAEGPYIKHEDMLIDLCGCADEDSTIQAWIFSLPEKTQKELWTVMYLTLPEDRNAFLLTIYTEKQPIGTVLELIERQVRSFSKQSLKRLKQILDEEV